MDYLEGRYCYFKRGRALIAFLIIFWKKAVDFSWLLTNEGWLVSNQSPYFYFVAIFVSAWAVVIPFRKIAWSVFTLL